MIAVNMHDAKTRLSELVRTVETTGEAVVLCRNGQPVAEIRPRAKRARPNHHLRADPRLRPTYAPGYHPAEPASAEDWPQDCR